ncbi:MAG: hypothetical protein K6F35_08740 [Lachnospiraceae bacterium]|nr:hypothetical protein [Lachnospiraceae bacterium]
MKITIYSTGGNDPDSLHSAVHSFYPTRAEDWDRVALMYPEHSFTVCCCVSEGHLVDVEGSKVLSRPEKVKTIILPLDADLGELARIIASTKPDVAYAAPLPNVAYDWNPLRDAMVGEELRKRGICVICPEVSLAEAAFEKNKTAELLRKHGFSTAKGVYVQMSLYRAEEKNSIILNNVYREYILRQIDDLRFPVIVKAASGAGSVGLSVAETKERLEEILLSGDPNADVMVEEKLEGENFGIEIYGVPGAYRVYEPILFTTAKEGITDPFASIKYGPVRSRKYKLEELRAQMLSMAEALCFRGGVELDLIFHGGEWTVVDLNPRFSLLSQMVGATADKSVPQLIAEAAIGGLSPADPGELKLAVDFKTRPASREELKRLRTDFPSVRSVLSFRLGITETETVSYSEIDVGGFEDNAQLLRELERISEKYGDLVTSGIVERIREMIKGLEA